MKPIRTLINSNIYISLAAVFLTIETQIQLGMKPQWQPYLLIIFFATLFEYNLHRLITVITNKKALESNKHKWVRENLSAFYFLIFISVAGFVFAAYLAKKEVLITLAPIALLTLFYSTPIFKSKKNIFRLREIPYLKIFIIAFVWAAATIILPIIQSSSTFNKMDILAMMAERFCFVFAITIPFDIRDLEADKQAGLKTIPLILNEKKAMQIANFFLLISFLISLFHYAQNSWFIVCAIAISCASTFLCFYSKKIQNLRYYHYGILDGTMLLQGILVLLFYWINLYL